MNWHLPAAMSSWSAPQRKRLVILALGAAAVATVELGLRAWDAQQKLERQLQQASNRVKVLRASADPTDWARRASLLSLEQEALKQQLWRAPTEAQAQSMLRDWLRLELTQQGLERAQVRLQSTQISDTQPVRGEREQAFRVRAQVSFELAPGQLEGVLERIEGGGRLAQIESMTASRRSRRVELAVSVPVLISNTPTLGKSP